MQSQAFLVVEFYEGEFLNPMWPKLKTEGEETTEVWLQRSFWQEGVMPSLGP